MTTPTPPVDSQQWGGPGYVPPAAPARRNGLATAALVLGLIGVPGAFLFIGGVFGVVAVVLGLLALGKVKRGEADGRGVAITGVVLGALAVLVAGAMVAFVAYFADSDTVKDFRDCVRAARTDADRDACANTFQQDLGGQ